MLLRNGRIVLDNQVRMDDEEQDRATVAQMITYAKHMNNVLWEENVGKYKKNVKTDVELEVFTYEDFIEYLSTKYNIADKTEIYRRKLMRLKQYPGGGENFIERFNEIFVEISNMDDNEAKDIIMDNVDDSVIKDLKKERIESLEELQQKLIELDYIEKTAYNKKRADKYGAKYNANR
eukprot:Pgem_evm1s10973